MFSFLTEILIWFWMLTKRDNLSIYIQEEDLLLNPCIWDIWCHLFLLSGCKKLLTYPWLLN